jgi:sphingomyelin phosphodiesterase
MPPVTEEQSKSLLKDFMLAMMRSTYGYNFSCEQCQKVNKEATELMSVFFLSWKPFMSKVCQYIGTKSVMTKDGCIALMGSYVPIVEKAFTKLFILNKGFICSFMLEKCDGATIDRLEVGPIIDQIYEGMPEKKEKTPTYRKTYKILQVNDIHIDLNYEPGTISNCKDGVVCCRANKTAGGDPVHYAGYWGATKGSCDIPKHTFQQFLLQIKKHSPEFVMWLGDNENHEVDLITADVNVETTYFLAGAFGDLANTTRFIVAIGNHENIPPDCLDFANKTQHNWFFGNLTGAYKPILTQDELNQIQTGGYYSTYFEEHNLRVINLLSAPNDALNLYLLVRSYDVDGQFNWLWNTLKDAEKNDEDVFITIHIPFGNDFSISLWDDLVSALVERFQNNIRAIFSAHTHNDHVTFFGTRGDREKVVKTQFIAPSLTTWTNLNPSYRVFEVDWDTNEIVDYTQYRLDLEKYNAMGANATLEWDAVYSFKDLYKVQDMSASSMQTIKDRFWNDYKSMGAYMYNFLTLTYQPGDNIDKKLAIRLRCTLYSNSRDALKCIGILTPFIASDIFPTLILSSIFPAYMKFKI